MKKKWYWLPAIIMMILIFYFSDQPGEISGDLSGGICYQMVSFAAEIFMTDWSQEEILLFSERIDYPVRKLAHLTEYALLGMAITLGVRYGRRKEWTEGYLYQYMSVQILGTLYAASDEWHQLYVPGRAGRMSDVLIDSLGIFIGWIVFQVIIKIRQKEEANVFNKESQIFE